MSGWVDAETESFDLELEMGSDWFRCDWLEQEGLLETWNVSSANGWDGAPVRVTFRVPEPSAAVLLLIALTTLGMRGRNRG